MAWLNFNLIYISKTPKIEKNYMFSQWIQTTSNIQSCKCFLQNSMKNVKYIALAMFAPLHYQLPLKQGMPFWKPIRKQDV